MPPALPPNRLLLRRRRLFYPLSYGWRPFPQPTFRFRSRRVCRDGPYGLWSRESISLAGRWHLSPSLGSSLVCARCRLRNPVSPLPNKRLKLAGALVLKEAVGSCPGGHATFVHHSCAGGRVARSLSAIR